MKRGPKSKSVDLHIVEGTHNATRHGNIERSGRNVEGLTPIRDMPDDVAEIWNRNVDLIWWNTKLESSFFDTWCDMEADLVLFKQGKVTRYTWTPAMFTQYRVLAAELGIGTSNRKDALQTSRPSSTSEHFDDGGFA